MLLLDDEASQSIIHCIKNINIKDVVYMSAATWDGVPALILARSWNKLLASEKEGNRITPEDRGYGCCSQGKC